MSKMTIQEFVTSADLLNRATNGIEGKILITINGLVEKEVVDFPFKLGPMCGICACPSKPGVID